MSESVYTEILEAVSSFPERVGSFLDALGMDPDPAAQSTASIDATAFGPGESARTLRSQAWFFNEVAGDNLYALPKLLTPPALNIAPFNCARGILESTSQAMWLLDSSLDPKGRLARSLSLRLRGLDESVRFFKADGDRSRWPEVVGRIEVVAQQAEERGVLVKRDSRTQRVQRIGETIPSATTLAARYFGAEALYRLFSSVVHGQNNFVLRLAFRPSGSPGFMVKYLDPKLAVLLLTRPSEWFARTVWEYVSTAGRIRA